MGGEFCTNFYFYGMLHQHAGNTEVYFRIRSFARAMRKNSTEAEDFFWERVRNRKLFGLKLNRQFIIPCLLEDGTTKYYIADFHCHKLKLVIELDGQIHLKQEEEDLIRTDRLIQRGFTVLRFENDMILNHWDEVVKRIKAFMDGK